MTEPFSSFMRRALFDPENGYYSRRIRTVGERGDFSTAATLSSLLAAGVAGWLRSELRAQPKIRAVIEVGGGDGSLMSGVRKDIGWWTRRGLKWHMVETSPVLRGQQKAKLGSKNVTWHDDLESALREAGGRAFIYHNELLDAFPCDRIEWDAESGTWREVWVRSERGEPAREELRERCWSDAEVAAFQALSDWTSATPPPSPRQRVELHASVRDWLSEWSREWKSGAMLTIDYGDLFPQVYHRRPRGTIRGYLHQQRTEGAEIYLNPGRQDLTADINFSDYGRWATDLGWSEVFFGSLRGFLNQHAADRVNRASGIDAQMIEEGSAADAFQCVVHRPV